MAELMVTARMIVSELEKRGLTVDAEIPESVSVLSFMYAGKPRILMGCIPDFTPAVTVPICRSKLMTRWAVSRCSDVRMPDTVSYDTAEAAHAFLERVGTVVVKPQDGAHGNGVTVGVRTPEVLDRTVVAAREASSSGTVLLQQMVKGNDVRILVLDGRIIAAAYRLPPVVVGDGTHTIRELIVRENENNPERGSRPYDKRLNAIDIAAAERYLGDRIDTVLAKDDRCAVVGTANIGTGGEAHECLSELPEAMKQDALHAAAAARAFICGVDFIYDPQSGDYYLIEMNSSPSFGLHAVPSRGTPVDVAAQYVDALLTHYDKESRV